MKLKTLFALVAFSSMAYSAIPEDDVSLLLGFGSYHFASQIHNEVNPAVGVKINNYEGARWEGSNVELGDTGVLPFFTIDSHQKITQNVYGMVAVNQDLMMFGTEYRF